MNNLKLRDKILLILILPILSIIFLSVLIFNNKYNEQNRMNKTHNFLKLSSDANKLLHNLQDERYFALKYLESYGKDFKDEFYIQNKKTDASIELLDNFLLNFNSNSFRTKLKETFNNYVKNIKKLTTLRKQIVKLEVDEKKIKDYYSLEIRLLTNFLENIIVISNDGIISKYAEVYISLSKAIESAYDEKLLLEEILIKGKVSNKESLLFNSFVISQNTYLDIFQNSEIDGLLKLESCKTCLDVKNIRKIIFQKNAKNTYLSSIKEISGYGGLIHNFKDFILRGDIKYLKRFEQLHTNLLRVIRKYKRIEGITKEEKKLLIKIQRVFDSYLLEINEVKIYKETKSAKEIDSFIKIDDSKAISAISELEKRIFGTNLDKWTKLSSKRIDILEAEQEKVYLKLLNIVEENINEINKVYILYIIIIIIILILVSISVTFMTRRIAKVIEIFQKNLNDFFAYALRENESITLSEVNGTDEFGTMHLNMKNRVIAIEESIEQDKKVVNEISDVMGKVSNGFFDYSIHEKGATSEVESLRVIINKMLNSTKLKIDNVNLVLDNYAKSNYTYSLDNTQLKGMYGDIGTLYTSTILLGQSASELIAMITNAGNSLNKSTQTLTHSSQKLSQSSQEQASSLEETASSLEEITSNIKNNNENITRMSVIADELNEAAKDGNTLANKTAKSMDNINEKVSAINDAITVIDKIAFQTNILSLNAAVEAATAGEAGKGFAVVAQEVRNLASRSSEAAKEIKSLVESAKNKSHEGKLIVGNMIKGYDNLNEKVSVTKDIIDNVTTFSKEQEIGIIQINQSITLIEKETQENALTAQNMDTLSKEASVLSDNLLDLTAQTNIDEIYLDMVHDIPLRNEVSKYKNEHINFKKEYFNTLDSFTTCSVVDCKSCNMGKWITNCEEEKKNFVNTNEWKDLKEYHTLVHKNIQKYLDDNALKVDNKDLRQTAKIIESSTLNVFDSLNKVLKVNSKEVKLQRS